MDRTQKEAILDIYKHMTESERQSFCAGVAMGQLMQQTQQPKQDSNTTD